MKFKIEFTLDFKDQETLKMLLENHTVEELTQNGYCYTVDKILNNFNITGTQEVSGIKVTRLDEEAEYAIIWTNWNVLVFKRHGYRRGKS